MLRPIGIFHLLLLAAICISPGKMFAQYDCSIQHFTTNNGFPDNEVTTLGMDYDGYLWIGTETSLVRYDGTNFKNFVFDTAKGSLKNKIMYAMPLPADKKLMIKTRRNPVYSIEKGNPVLYSDSAFPDRGDWKYIWGNFTTAAYYKKFYKVIFGLIDVGDYMGLLSLNNTDFIAASLWGNKYTYFRNGVKQPAVTMNNNINMFITFKNYHFLLDDQFRMHLFDSVANQFKEVSIDWRSISKTKINIKEAGFFSDPFSGGAFCSYNSTFYALDFDASENLVKFIPQFSIKDGKHFWTGLVYDTIHSVFFLSTLTDGFFEVKLKKIKTFNPNDSLPKDISPGIVVNYSVVNTSDSTAVIPTGFRFTATASGIKIKKIAGIFGNRESVGVLKDGSILGVGLNYFSPKEDYRVTHNYNDSFARSNHVQNQMAWPEGDSVWVSTNPDVFLITPKTIKHLFGIEGNPGGINPTELHFFQRISKEEAFVSNPYGLYRFHTVAPYKIEMVAGTKGMFVQGISDYKGARILSAYMRGLHVLKDNRLYKVPLPEGEEGLMLCHTNYIDRDGYIWITSDKGLFKTTASSVVEAALNPASTPPFFFYYGNEDGIENTQFTGGGVPPYAALKGGWVLFPTLSGMIHFKTDEPNDKITNTPVLIEKITIDNKEINKRTDSIRLHPDFKYLVVDLSVPNFGNAKNLSIAYSLDKKEWKAVTASDNMKITLTDISSGDHQLVIRKRTGFGNNDYIFSQLAINRGKFIYERTWFYPVLLALFGFIVWAYTKLKTRSINRKRKFLQRKVNEQTTELSKAGEIKDLLISIISHDMVSPLRHVATIAKVLKGGHEKDPQRVEEALSDIQTTSERILSGSNTIINWMKYNNKKIPVDKEAIDLRQMVQETVELYVPIAKSKNVTLINDVPVATFVEADHNILHTILTNLFSNAVKYTDSGTVRLFTETTGGTSGIVFTVQDTGRGMSEKKLRSVREILKGNVLAVKSEASSSGLGYVMISELLKIHGLQATLDSEVGIGTTVSLFLNSSPA